MTSVLARRAQRGGVRARDPRAAVPMPLAFGFATLAALLAIASLCIGARHIPVAEIWDALINHDPASPVHDIIRERRIPRTMVALIAGASLSLAGALLQTMTRNPLADTGVLGVNAGAAFLAAVTLSVLGWSSPVLFVLAALTGAALTIGLISKIGKNEFGTLDPLKIVLAGVAIGAVLEGVSDGLTLVDPQVFARVRGWLLGSVDVTGYSAIGIVSAGLVVGIALIVPILGSINQLAMGEDSAAALGVNVRRTRLLLLLAVTVLASTTTAAVGVFTFVGLATPHIIRRMGFYADRQLIILSALAGPSLVLAADILGRVIVRSELPASVVVAFIAGPILIALAQKEGLYR